MTAGGTTIMRQEVHGGGISFGHIWQIPVFLLGVAVFVAAHLGWLPSWSEDEASAYGRLVANLQEACARVTPDREEIRTGVETLAARGDPPSGWENVGHYVLGSGYVRLAELTSAESEAQHYWQAARRHLEQVQGEALDPEERPRWTFRLTKARAATHRDTPPSEGDIRVWLAVLAAVPHGEDAGEAGRLQAELALRLSPPDWSTARDGLTKYLLGAGLATPPESLARAKLKLGELLVRRKDWAQARKWLEQIGPEAPEMVQAAGRFLLAQVKIAEDDWQGAARDLELLRGLTGSDPALRRRAAYHLAFCKQQMREYQAALPLYEEAAGGAPPESQAAALRLAELLLKEPTAERRLRAVPYLQQATRELSSTASWRNQFLRLNEAVAIFELALGTLTDDGQFEAALAVIEAYRPLCQQGRDREKRAEVLAAWVETLQRRQEPLAERAMAAAQEYEHLASLPAPPAQQAEWLRRAALLYRQAGQLASAITALRQAVQRPELPESLASLLWAELGETLVAAEQPLADILKAFNEALANAGPAATRVRYRLARRFIDSRDNQLRPLALALFEQIASQQTISETERDYHERALIELAHDHIRAGRFAEAEVWLRKQIALYPTGAEAPLARLLLGICLVQRSTAPPPLQPDLPTAQRLREEAAQLFQQVIDEMERHHQRHGQLDERQAWLRLQAHLRLLQTYLLMNTTKSLNELLFEADRLRERHRGTVEELIILSLMYHAFKLKGDPVRERQIRDQMKELFDRLPPNAFPATTGEYSRSYWQKVWFAGER
jgi:TolA-binding protein